MLICGFKYINSKLKVDFDLDTTFKPKPVARLDDLLLLLVQHWARDEFVFSTEDDRHNVTSIMLFQSYTGRDPLGEIEFTNKIQRIRETTNEDYGDEYDAGDSDSDHDENTDASADQDNSYNTNGINVTMTEDTNNYDTTKADKLGKPLQQACDAKLDEFLETRRVYKVLYYEDICL